MKFTDFTKTNLDGFDSSEVIRQAGNYPSIVFTVGGTESDGQIIFTVGEAIKRQEFNRRPAKSYSELVSESLNNIYGGSTAEIPM